jgi:anthranilate phosphoribosyltransferase
MSITAYLKEIGRGKQGARSLDAAQAQDLMTQIFEGHVSDVQLGAFAIAMRVKGESAAELAGFLAATQAHMTPAIAKEIQSSARPVIWLPSYNGARKLPNLTPLLAGLLARQGLSVIVHGLPSDPPRVTSHAIFEALGWPIVNAPSGAAAANIGHAWAMQCPVFVTTEALCPPLARLLAVRKEVGLRNSGHTIAKLLALPHLQAAAPSLPHLQAAQPSLRVVNHTHPEYAVSLAQFLTESKADALLLRGTEGEPVADARRTPRMDAFVAGQRLDALSVAAQGGVLARVPQLPAAIDAATTAAFTIEALSGASAVPGPIQTQVGALFAMAERLTHGLEHAA